MSEKAKETAKKVNKDEMQKLTDEQLGKVSGAGDPFADRPRVPTKPISDSVRKKG